MAKTIKTTTNIPFSQVTKYLFCVDCKKRVPGCNPSKIEFHDQTADGKEVKKIKSSIVCKVETKKITVRQVPKPSRKGRP